MLNMNQLRHFQLVAREGSFARAAEAARITQPALSNSVRTLEQKVGFRLIERAVRPVSLTPMGRELLQRVDQLLFEARNLDQAIENLTTGHSGHVRVGMTAVFATSLGGLIVAEFHERFPNVKLDLEVGQTSTMLAALREEDLDLIVGNVQDIPLGADDLDIVDLPSQPGGAFCRAGHPVLTLGAPSPADLAPYRFAATHFPEDVAGDVDEFLGTSRLEGPHITVDSHNVAVLRDAVARTDLILLTTHGCVRNELALGILCEIPVSFGIRGAWATTTLRGRVTHPSIPSLIDNISKVAAREQERGISAYA